MKKTIILSTLIAAFTLSLAGCGRSTLSVDKSKYAPSGLTAVVQGKSNQKEINYQIPGQAKQAQKVQNGTFSFMVPAKLFNQNIKVTSANLSKNVKVTRAKPMIKYSKLAKNYNQALIGMNLSKSQQRAALNLKKQAAALKTAQPSLALMQKAAVLKKEQANLTSAMNKAKAKVSDQLLPTKATNGIKNYVNTNSHTIRINVDNDQVIGIATILPIHALKNKSLAQKFIVSFSILGSELGANSKKVLKEFQNETKSGNSSQTTIKTITSNKIKYDIGFSTTSLYIYITR